MISPSWTSPWNLKQTPKFSSCLTLFRPLQADGCINYFTVTSTSNALSVRCTPQGKTHFLPDSDCRDEITLDEHFVDAEFFGNLTFCCTIFEKKSRTELNDVNGMWFILGEVLDIEVKPYALQLHDISWWATNTSTKHNIPHVVEISFCCPAFWGLNTQKYFSNNILP